MKISVRWLNEYLSPGTLTAEQAEHALTFAGFPIESIERIDAAGGADACLDVEVTSNRGDVLSHLGVAREISALTGRTLRIPAPDSVFGWSPTPAAPTPAHAPPAADAATLTAVDNRVPETCRLFTAQVIRGVKVGPSPQWLVDALAAVGQRSINNVVDITNFVALEYGQPSHVFDMATVSRDGAGRHALIVRVAARGEKLKLLDGKVITLAGDELVVADSAGGGRAISLAGVMGGADTEVTAATTDVILEAATWDPVAVRRAARRFNIRTDASYRFERTVDPRTIAPAAARAAALIVRLAGGQLARGVVSAGPSATATVPIRLRPARVAQMLGVSVPLERIREILGKLEITCAPAGGASPDLSCTVPPHRPDLTREIDLIEEVARIHGLDKLPVSEKIAARIAPPQESERAMAELARVLTGLGFYEAVTFTFVSERAAKPFIPRGMASLAVCDERRKADPVLRPSALPSLLACRRANQDAGVSGDGAGGIRLYETSAVFGQIPAPADAVRGAGGARGREVENRNLALLADAAFPEGAKALDRAQSAVRLIRGAIEAVALALGGESVRARLIFEPAPAGGLPVAAFDPEASGLVTLDGRPLGLYGMIAPGVQREHALAVPVCAAEVNLDALVGLFPPRALGRTLPQFPSIERDLSLVVPESTPWAAIERLVAGARPPLMEQFWFVTTYRGQPLPAGRKSVTFRMRFRDSADQRTLRHEEVDPQVAGLIERARRELGAEVRA